jgi:multidrug efflux pump subunit AcrA (membrane-fusion protein)
MNGVSKAAAAGIIFFSIVLAGFVGIKVDQSTIALLGGAFIGLVVAIPTTAAIILIGTGAWRAFGQQQPPPAPPPPAQGPTFPQYQQPQQIPPSVTWVTNNHYNVTINVVKLERPERTYSLDELALETASQLKVLPSQAVKMIGAGQVVYEQLKPGEKRP